MKYALATTVVIFLLLLIFVLNAVVPILTQSIQRLVP